MIDSIVCDEICNTIESDATGKWRRPKLLPGGTGLCIYTADSAHISYQTIQHYFPHKHIHTVRVHRFDADDCVGPHTDTAFPGCDVVIIRLDTGSESRLLIDGTMVVESRGMGYYLPEHTVHEIIKGTEPRYTLVAWFINP
jgi:hypothetical protein